jgi:hypothetical protein
VIVERGGGCARHESEMYRMSGFMLYCLLTNCIGGGVG